eukprot:TRINITY_DN10429_c0_g1_i1.p1 TRINITY_DN10429_c0_g1~~TRINITY_DN10429_c0_g1_i1.p1  ORF type:complete len:189 (-),score=32.41 TRINITY_DN10429_c0_g1_i1:30-596(-)
MSLPKFIFVALVLVALFSCVLSDSGFLITRKAVLNTEVVKNKETLVIYQIYNVGDSPAYNVSLTDDTWPAEYFDISLGITSVNLEKLAPKSNYTHILAIRPKFSGRIETRPALVEYQVVQKGEKRISYSTDAGYMDVYLRSENERRKSPHLGAWTVFGFLTVFATVPAAGLWAYYNALYTTQGGKKKQ